VYTISSDNDINPCFKLATKLFPHCHLFSCLQRISWSRALLKKWRSLKFVNINYVWICHIFEIWSPINSQPTNPSKRPCILPINQSINQSIDWSINQLVTWPTDWQTNQPTSQPNKQTTSQSIDNLSINQSVSQSFICLVNHLFSQLYLLRQ